jgi:hypothetical protein
MLPFTTAGMLTLRATFGAVLTVHGFTFPTVATDLL